MSEYLEERTWSGWVNRIKNFLSVSENLTPQRKSHIHLWIQNLGQMDVELIQLKKEFFSIEDFKKGNLDQSHLQNYISFREYLWIIGAFEVLRIIKESCNHKVDNGFKELYESFKSIRVPLAKAKKPDSVHGFNYNNNFDIPVSVIMDNQILLQISPKKFISREILADKFYNFIP